MSRHLAKLICLAAGAVAGWQVWLNLEEVIDERWIPRAAGGGTMLAVFLLLYFLLARPVADVIADRLSALRSRVKSTRAGTGLDQVPDRDRASTPLPLDTCRICGGPGGPVCDSCRRPTEPG
jgi:hypothetical protein